MRLAPLLALVLAGCAGLAARPAPRLLPSAAAVGAALAEGREVKAVLRYARCTLLGEDGAERPGPDVTGGMTIAAFERFAAGTVGNAGAYLATSQSQLIGHPRHGHVVNYVRLRIEDGGRVGVTARYLRPPALEVVMDETFTCAVDEGSGKGGAAFYAAP